MLIFLRNVHVFLATSEAVLCKCFLVLLLALVVMTNHPNWRVVYKQEYLI